MDVAGISFHIGGSFVLLRTCLINLTLTKDLESLRTAISEAISLAKDAKFNLRILDIGGGSTSKGSTSKNYTQAAYHLRQEIAHAQQDFPNLQSVAEPGRFLACSAFTLTCQVIGKRGESTPPRLYLNDGIFGNFINAFFEQQQFWPC